MTHDADHLDCLHRGAHVDLTILSQPRYLCVVRTAVEAAARQLGLAREEADAVVIAVDEAVSNVIRHGYAMADDRPIRVLMGPACRHEVRGVQVEVEDACEHVSPQDIQARSRLRDALADPGAPAPPPAGDGPSTPGGLGLHLIRRAMDRVEFHRRDDGCGISLRMFKAAGSAATSGSDPSTDIDASHGSEGAEP